jgi:hypothetical protein
MLAHGPGCRPLSLSRGLRRSPVAPQRTGAIPMSEAEYRERAERCEKEAAAAPNCEIRARLERIAKYWRELALMAQWRLKPTVTTQVTNLGSEPVSGE